MSNYKYIKPNICLLLFSFVCIIGIRYTEAKGDMRMEKTLEQLAEEYLLEEQKLNRQIKAWREKAAQLSGDRRRTANRNLICLYEMRREVSCTADKLMHYYDTDGKKLYHSRSTLH